MLIKDRNSFKNNTAGTNANNAGSKLIFNALLCPLSLTPLWEEGKSIARSMLILIICVLAIHISVSADTYATYGTNGCTGASPQYPDGIGLSDGSNFGKRLYNINFKSNIDAAADFYFLGLPHTFDSTKAYAVWFQFKPMCGSGTNLCNPTFAWNYCDSNNVIFIGVEARMHLGGCDEWFGDNTNNSQYGTMIGNDLKELLSELCYLFNIKYVATSGASMGGYSSLRFLTYLPKEYIGATVPSCPALWYRPWCKAGSDAVGDSVKHGHMSGAFVKLMHGTADGTCDIKYSDSLTGLAPDKTWWEEVRVAGAGHQNFFYRDTAAPWPHDCEAGQSAQVRDMWQQIKNWETAHPEKVNRTLAPLPGWTVPTNWYVPQNIYNARDRSKTFKPAFSCAESVSVAPAIPLSFKMTCSNPNGSTITLAVTQKPAWITFNGADSLKGSSGLTAGTDTVTAVASVSAVPQDTLVLKIRHTANPSYTSADSVSVVIGAPFRYKISCTNPGPYTIKTTIRLKPAWVTFDSLKDSLKGTAPSAPGLDTVMITANVYGQPTDTLYLRIYRVSPSLVAFVPGRERITSLFSPGVATLRGNVLDLGIHNLDWGRISLYTVNGQCVFNGAPLSANGTVRVPARASLGTGVHIAVIHDGMKNVAKRVMVVPQK